MCIFFQMDLKRLIKCGIFILSTSIFYLGNQFARTKTISRIRNRSDCLFLLVNWRITHKLGVKCSLPMLWIWIQERRPTQSPPVRSRPPPLKSWPQGIFTEEMSLIEQVSQISCGRKESKSNMPFFLVLVYVKSGTFHRVQSVAFNNTLYTTKVNFMQSFRRMCCEQIVTDSSRHLFSLS